MKDDGVVLFLDFCKAFDRIEHLFIIKTLEYFGFGLNFINMISMSYEEINSVALHFGTTKRFEMKHGFQQGYAFGPLLFISASELLVLYIKNKDIRPLHILGILVVITQLATLFFEDLSQIFVALEVVSVFTDMFGLKLIKFEEM